MGVPASYTRSVLLADHRTTKSRIIFEKKKKPKQPKTRNPSHPGLKRKNGLLNAVIPARSKLMQSAQRNSLESPLLRLPGEIRTKIWEFALGYHQVNICGQSQGNRWNIELGHDTQPLHVTSTVPRAFVRPTFAIPRVCRQMYTELSAMVYTLNNFGFDNHDTFDRWIKGRAFGQKQLITSIDIPFAYYNLYEGGFRKLFRQTFPNIKRVRLHLQMALLRQRVIEGSWLEIKPKREPLGETKLRFARYMQEKEGVEIEVDWHHGTLSSLVNAPR
ncbi:hypothetical protein EJ02DRAFT_389673 [Clathrospora elynae]|uniref:DUF7730 domain-containing protein n=1 Tax=Clathrospora elynae TaxID=706981 RepID=A0A6A5S4P6_9PLEO|nr:hypothetical protein EJ02DRAFT_389673 [Clathrospora elynae]